MKRALIFIFALLILISGLLFLYSAIRETRSPQDIQSINNTNMPIPEETIYSARFAIFTNGTFRVFTDARYHNLSKDVFIENQNPNIIQVKKSGLTWDDFFKTLPMKLTSECLTTGTGQVFCTNNSNSLKFYINGIEDKYALDKGINKGDKLLVSYGKNDETTIKNHLETLSGIGN